MDQTIEETKAIFSDYLKVLDSGSRIRIFIVTDLRGSVTSYWSGHLGRIRETPRILLRYPPSFLIILRMNWIDTMLSLFDALGNVKIKVLLPKLTIVHCTNKKLNRFWYDSVPGVSPGFRGRKGVLEIQNTPFLTTCIERPCCNVSKDNCNEYSIEAIKNLRNRLNDTPSVTLARGFLKRTSRFHGRHRDSLRHNTLGSVTWNWARLAQHSRHTVTLMIKTSLHRT